MTHIWPVIHIETPEIACANAAMAARNGAKGVFLIQMEGSDHKIDPIAQLIREAHPNLLIGVNYLSLPAPRALSRAIENGYAASWSDNPGVRSDCVAPFVADIERMLEDHPEHLFFGSVAFKYQKKEPDPGEAARRALDFRMLPTTSGQATGHAPEVEKLIAIRGVIGDQPPLALASGVTPENAAALSPYLSDILVSTGISANFYEFDEDKLVALMQAVQR